MANRTCWAQGLGGCRDGKSGEHIVSENQFDGSKAITVEGMHYCLEGPKTIGLASFVSNCLCAGHNSDLSPADDEAKRFKNALRDFYSKPHQSLRVEIDARLIERWVLKTAINFALLRATPKLEVSDELVNIAFGKCLPRPGCGLFLVARAGDDVYTKPGTIRHQSFASFETDRVVLVALEFHGTQLLYALDDAPPIDGAVRHRGFFNIDDPADSIALKWSPDFAPDDYRMRSAHAAIAGTP